MHYTSSDSNNNIKYSQGRVMIKRNIVELKSLTKKYNNNGITTNVLNDIFLTVQQSDYVSIFGQSGAGKTALLSILGLMDNAYTGSYKLNDLDIYKLSNRQLAKLRNKEIGYVFQSVNLISDLTVFENIAMPVRYSGKNWSNVKQSVFTALKTVNMRHSYTYYPDELTIGQQRLLSIARAMVMCPSILIVDEPTSNLNSHNSELVMNVLKEINNKGVTLFIATHDANDADQATTKLNLFDGEIIAPSEFKSVY